jgi:flagellar protein FlaG
MSVYEINEVQNNANKSNSAQEVVAGYANQKVNETFEKEATKPIDKTENTGTSIVMEDNAKAQTKDEYSNIEISSLVSSVNKYVDAVSNNKVNFQYDESKDQHIVLVKDKDTNEIIREIPPKEMLDLLKNLEDITGIIYDNKI